MVNPDPHPEPNPIQFVPESQGKPEEPLDLEPLSPLTDDGQGDEDLIMSTAYLQKPSQVHGSKVNKVPPKGPDVQGSVPVPVARVFGSTPSYGLKLGMSHEFPETWDHRVIPRLNQIPDLLPMCLRYFIYRIFIWFKGREPFIDMFTVKAQQIYGGFPYCYY
jgi:hypothetical protein